VSQDINPPRAELKKLLRILMQGLRLLKAEDLVQTPCPDSWTLAAYVTGELDQKTQREINAHIAFCDACFDDFVALAGTDKIAEMLSNVPAGEEAAALQSPKPAVDIVVDLREAYRLEFWRELNVLPYRDKSFRRMGDFEVSLGEDLYEVQFWSNAEASVSCTVRCKTATMEVLLGRRRVCVSVVVVSEKGKVIFSTQTNDSGYCKFTIPTSGLDDFCVLSLEQGKHCSKLRVYPPRRPFISSRKGKVSYRDKPKSSD
jgi:hypothetical protein